MLKFEEVATGQGLGTLGELTPENCEIKFSKDNLEGDKRIFLRVLHDGKEAKVTCSPRVSEKIRAKELKLSDLWNLQVNEVTNKEGEIIPMIVLEGASFTVKKDLKTATQYKAPAYNPKDLVAF